MRQWFARFFSRATGKFIDASRNDFCGFIEQRGSFFVDDPTEVERNRSRGRLRWSYVGVALVLSVVVRLLGLRTEFVLGGAVCGVMLAWAPLVAAAYVRLQLRRRG